MEYNEYVEFLEEVYDDLVLADGFEKAILGICDRFGQPSIVAYDYEKCIDILMSDDMTREEAEEFFEFNVIGSYVGDRTPCFIIRKPVEELEDESEKEDLHKKQNG